MNGRNGSNNPLEGLASDDPSAKGFLDVDYAPLLDPNTTDNNRGGDPGGPDASGGEGGDDDDDATTNTRNFWKVLGIAAAGIALVYAPLLAVAITYENKCAEHAKGDGGGDGGGGTGTGTGNVSLMPMGEEKDDSMSMLRRPPSLVLSNGTIDEAASDGSSSASGFSDGNGFGWDYDDDNDDEEEEDGGSSSSLKKTKKKKKIMIVDMRDSFIPHTTKIACQACAGLFNRPPPPDETSTTTVQQQQQPKNLPLVYTIMNGDGDEDMHWLHEFHLEKHIFHIPWIHQHYLSPTEFLQKCLVTFPRRVRYRYYGPPRRVVPNVLTVGAVLNAIPITDGDPIFDTVKQDSLTVVFDAITHRSFHNNNAREATEYVYNTYSNQTSAMAKLNPGYDTKQRPSVINEREPPLIGELNPGLIDWIYSQRLFTYYMYYGCSKVSPNSIKPWENEARALVQRMSQDRASGSWGTKSTPLPVYGYDDTWDVGGGTIFEAETICTERHNMGQIATRDVNNLGFFGRFSEEVKVGEIVLSPRFVDGAVMSSVVGVGARKEVVAGAKLEMSTTTTATGKKTGGGIEDGMMGRSTASVERRDDEHMLQRRRGEQHDDDDGTSSSSTTTTTTTTNNDEFTSSPILTYDPSKIYVALVVGDGDNVRFVKSSRANWMNQRVDKCHKNKQDCFPLTWTMSPHLAKLAPDILRWFVQKALAAGTDDTNPISSGGDNDGHNIIGSSSSRPADTFILPPSGHLYAYPGLMPSDVQDQFVNYTEYDALVLNTTGVVDWELFTSWKKTLKEFYPKYTKSGIIRGIFAVNVPYMVPTGEFMPNEYYRIIHPPAVPATTATPVTMSNGTITTEVGEGTGVGHPVVLFRPREWRGTTGNQKPQQDFLSPSNMAKDLSSHPPGTVSYVYMTSDGGLDYNAISTMASLLPDTVELVSTEVATALALEAAKRQGKLP